jgi:hypothetical protein
LGQSFFASACTSERSSMDWKKLNDFAARYTAAWCSQNASSVAFLMTKTTTFSQNADEWR